MKPPAKGKRSRVVNGMKWRKGCKQWLPVASFPPGSAMCIDDRKVLQNLDGLCKRQGQEKWFHEMCSSEETMARMILNYKLKRDACLTPKENKLALANHCPAPFHRQVMAKQQNIHEVATKAGTTASEPAAILDIVHAPSPQVSRLSRGELHMLGTSRKEQIEQMELMGVDGDGVDPCLIVDEEELFGTPSSVPDAWPAGPLDVTPKTPEPDDKDHTLFSGMKVLHSSGVGLTAAPEAAKAGPAGPTDATQENEKFDLTGEEFDRLAFTAAARCSMRRLDEKFREKLRESIRVASFEDYAVNTHPRKPIEV